MSTAASPAVEATPARLTLVSEIPVGSSRPEFCILFLEPCGLAGLGLSFPSCHTCLLAPAVVIKHMKHNCTDFRPRCLDSTFLSLEKTTPRAPLQRVRLCQGHSHKLSPLLAPECSLLLVGVCSSPFTERL